MNKKIGLKEVLRFIGKFTHLFGSLAFVIPLLIIVDVVDSSLRPYILKVITNLLHTNSDGNLFQILKLPILGYLAAVAFPPVIYRIYEYFVQIRMWPVLHGQIVAQATTMLMQKSHTFYQDNYPGNMVSKVNDLATSTIELMKIVLYRLIGKAATLLVAVWSLWQVNPKFAILMLIWSIVFTLVSLVAAHRLSKLANEWSEQGSIVSGKLVDILSNILSVRLFTAYSQEAQNLQQSITKSTTAERALHWAYSKMWYLYDTSYLIMLALNFYFLIVEKQRGTITVGDFVFVITVNIIILHQLWTVAREFADLSKHFGRITQALELILEPEGIQDKPNAKPLHVTDGTIAFEKVKFNYQDVEPMFENKTIYIKPGQKVGLVGHSGSGKTTFVNLILRLYDVTGGRILIDDQNIQEATQNSLRQAVAVIPQDQSLFHRTVIENIRYGKEDATDEQIIQAAKFARAHEFISRLPEGYETQVGERGIKLSGGQRQRIAIARAFLKDAPILILDEATSQLDSVTENEIKASLDQLMNMNSSSNKKPRTTLAIAHRLSTLLNMDRILVFDKGKIVQDGTHEQLLTQEGMYKTLWKAQVGGFIAQ